MSSPIPPTGDNSNPVSSVAGRATRGTLYSVAASALTLSFGLLRTILLLYFLLPDHFGVATQALFFLHLVGLTRMPGLDRAFVHYQNADNTVFSTYFTMRMGLLLFSILLGVALVPLIAPFYPDMPLLAPVLITFLAADLIAGLAAVQETMLNKELNFRPLAFANVISSITMTIVAPLLAWQGWGVWSLVFEPISGQIARVIVFWLASKRFRPTLVWDWNIARWFWSFGLKNWGNLNLIFLLNRFDDFWIGTALGKTSLGYYSRAYEFANYPRRMVANPLLAVFFPVFAHLQNAREPLSKAFFRSTSIIIRVGFWLSLILMLVAPEFILLLGEKWRPMQLTFQLMIIYTALDPIGLAAANLVLAVGQPGKLLRVRIIQAIIFIPAVILLSMWMGIAGVALAANLMALAGAVLLFRQARAYVDFSMRRLWLWPTVGFALTASSVLLLNPFWSVLNVFAVLLGKMVLITLLFGGLLAIMEKEQLHMVWQMARGMMKERFPGTASR
ncbi:MAG: oligosaccharide flippase family protein [Litorilinea sp.]